MKKLLFAMSVILAAGVAGWGGYGYYRHTVCIGLKSDFLDAVTNMKTALLAKGTDGDTDARLLEADLAKMGNECGADASQAALRQARDSLPN